MRRAEAAGLTDPASRRLLVIGASRGIGRAAVAEALARGHVLRALARSAENDGKESTRLETVAADATDPVALRGAVEGMDAVILALGVPADPRRMCRRVELFSRATEALVPQMRAAGCRRLVAVTGFGAGESHAAMSRLERLPHGFFLGTAYADKDRQEALIRESGLDWLIVRPTILTNGPRTRRYLVLRDRRAWRNGLVSRADVAHFLVSQAADGDLSHEGPVLAY